MVAAVTTEDRFWTKVQKTESCWLWVGSRQTRTHDYGYFWHNHRVTFAHRVSWELANGPIPDGMSVLHSCDNPPCVNPAHLFLGTQADNMKDMVRRGRSATSLRRAQQVGIRPVTTHRSSRFGHGKLTEQDVRQIRESYGSDCSQYELAERYNVCQSNISAILKRQTWRHVRPCEELLSQ